LPAMSYSISENKQLKDFGARVRQARTTLGWSQDELAYRSGLHRTYVGAVERGERNVALLNLRKLAAALGRSGGGLLDG
jgi:transcriptional regulator with XRE-family HTH domain